MRQKSKFILTVFFVISTVCVAQDIPQVPEPAPLATTPPGLPVDAGVLLLLVAGVFYGVKKKLKR